MAEEWRDIPGYEGLYQVSDLGRVRSLDRMTNFRRCKKLPMLKGKVLSNSNLDAYGYPQVGLSKNNVIKTYKVHRLVLLTFIGPCPKGMETRHFPNRDRTDNRLVNLSWGTVQQNKADRLPQGTSDRGANHPRAKLTESEVIEILHRSKSKSESQKVIAADYGIHPAHVSNILNRRIWKHITLP